MQIVKGRICGLLNDEAGEINGFLLDSGRTVNFPAERASRVFAITSLGCRVEVEARMCDIALDGSRVDAVRVTDLDSNRSVSLFEPMSFHTPEVSADQCLPLVTTTPLVPALEKLWGLNLRQISPGQLGSRNDIVNEIGLADDALHRIQAMISYLKIIEQEPSAIGEYLDEAKHTYVQALSRYQVQDLEGAREFAAASNNLSCVVELLISRTFRSNTDFPKLAPTSQKVVSHDDAGTVRKGLDLVDSLLTRIRWIAENGTLPSEDRAQVQKLSSWSANLNRWAYRFIEAGAIGDAIQFAQAAGAAACSAEHLCKKCYATRGADSNRAMATL